MFICTCYDVLRFSWYVAGKWSANKCSDLHGYVCKRRTVSVVETPREPHYIGGCPEEWLYFGHKVQAHTWTHTCIHTLESAIYVPYERLKQRNKNCRTIQMYCLWHYPLLCDRLFWNVFTICRHLVSCVETKKSKVCEYYYFIWLSTNFAVTVRTIHKRLTLSCYLTSLHSQLPLGLKQDVCDYIHCSSVRYVDNFRITPCWWFSSWVNLKRKKKQLK